MLEDMPEIEKLVRDRINEHGHLHLDKAMTIALVQWLVKVEIYLKEYEVRFNNIKKLLVKDDV